MEWYELLKLKYEMDEASKNIPTNGDFACNEITNYHDAASKFLEAGRIYYNDNNISMDELQKIVKAELDVAESYLAISQLHTDEELAVLREERTRKNMNKLYLLKKQLDELNNKIPKYEKDFGVETKEEIEYNTFLKKFVTVGREILRDEKLSDKDIIHIINDYRIKNIKVFLQKDNNDMLNSLDELDEMGSDTLQFLENCLIAKENDEWSFERDELFFEEREFLNQFTSNDISKFKNFSNFLIDYYSSESKKTK